VDRHASGSFNCRKPTRRSFRFLIAKTIRWQRQGEGKICQTGTVARAKYGHDRIEMEPGEPGTGFECVTRSVWRIVPKEYIGPARKRHEGNLPVQGVIAGFPDD